MHYSYKLVGFARMTQTSNVAQIQVQYLVEHLFVHLVVTCVVWFGIDPNYNAIQIVRYNAYFLASGIDPKYY